MSTSTQEINSGCIVLGSRSPQRFELLSQLVGQDRIHVCPPLNSNEADFEGMQNVEEISQRLCQIARKKRDDVMTQLERSRDPIDFAAILTADTVIVAYDEAAKPVVLGQPPADDTWPDVVRTWFDRYLLRAPHLAITAISVSSPSGQLIERTVTTRVSFSPDGVDWLDWYIGTGEPLGKAGGYGLQGAGSLFVDHIEGSPSNVVGLPLRETLQVLRGLELNV